MDGNRIEETNEGGPSIIADWEHCGDCASDPGRVVRKTDGGVMDISEFAEKHGLRVKRDLCGERFIPCRAGQIYENGGGSFGVLVMAATAKRWNSIRRKLEIAGFVIRQSGDTEGSLVFDPVDDAQCRAAIRVMRPYRVKRLSAEERQKLAQALATVRKPPQTLNKMAAGSPESVPGSGAIPDAHQGVEGRI